MVVVILLREEIRKELDIQFSIHSNWDTIINEPVSPIFSDGVIYFFNEFSKKIQEHFEIREYTDLATFAFFCRKSNLKKLEKEGGYNQNNQIGRGITFHIAPSNVPLNFAYSLLMGMLAGNINIVRLPSKKFKQIDIFLDILCSLKDKEHFNKILSKIILLRYERNKEITDFFSSICNNRVIWGGDNSINEIRKSSISAKSYDITFSDRYSICVLDVNSILECPDLKKIALDFYNDTYLFDQNACTSPHLLIWVGDEGKLLKAKNIFWNEINNILKNKKYQIEVSSVIDKLIFAQEQAIEGEINSFQKISNSLFITEINQLNENISKSHSNCGYFNNYYCGNLDELTILFNSSKYQTITYYGLDKEMIKSIIFSNGMRGVDRVVPVGMASDFNPVWDGYNIINSLSRIIKII